MRACFAGLWIHSFEHEDALAEIAQFCRREGSRLAIWDIEQSLQVAGESDGAAAAGADPLAAIRSLGALASQNTAALLVLVNFRRFLNSAEVVQALARQVTLGKQQRTFTVILSPVVQLPVEMERQFVVLDHELPGRQQLAEIAQGVATDDGELPTGGDLETLNRPRESLRPTAMVVSHSSST